MVSRYACHEVLADTALPEPRVKGAVVREMLLWYEDHYGHEALGHLLRNVPREYALSIAPSEPAFGLLASTWYPSSFINAVLDALLDECRKFQAKVARGETKLGEKKVDILPPDPIGELGSGWEKVEKDRRSLPVVS